METRSDSFVGTFPIKCNSIEEARVIFQQLTPLLRANLDSSFSQTYILEVPDLADICAAIDKFSESDKKYATLSQSFHLFKGWREGVSIGIYWEATTPQIIKLKSTTETMMEERAFSIFSMGPGLTLAVLGMFSTRLRLLKMLAMGAFGFLSGSIAYLFFARPIIRTINRPYLAKSQQLAQKAYKELDNILKSSFKERLEV